MLCLLMVFPDQVSIPHQLARCRISLLLDCIHVVHIVLPGAWRRAPFLLLLHAFRRRRGRGFGCCDRLPSLALLVLDFRAAANFFEVFVKHVERAPARLSSVPVLRPLRTLPYRLLSGSHVRSVGSSYPCHFTSYRISPCSCQFQTWHVTGGLTHLLDAVAHDLLDDVPVALSARCDRDEEKACAYSSSASSSSSSSSSSSGSTRFFAGFFSFFAGIRSSPEEALASSSLRAAARRSVGILCAQ